MTHDINKDTQLIPYIIAEQSLWNVLESDARFNDLAPHEMNKIVSLNHGELVERAERLYANNQNFRKQINNKRKDCRYTLGVFMEHWAMAIKDRIYKESILTQQTNQ